MYNRVEEAEEHEFLKKFEGIPKSTEYDAILKMVEENLQPLFYH